MPRARTTVALLAAAAAVVVVVALRATCGGAGRTPDDVSLATDDAEPALPRTVSEPSDTAAGETSAVRAAKPRPRARAAGPADETPPEPVPPAELVPVRIRVRTPDGRPAAGARLLVGIRFEGPSVRIEQSGGRMRFVTDRAPPVDLASLLDPNEPRTADGAGEAAIRVAPGHRYTFTAILGEDLGRTSFDAGRVPAEVEMELAPGFVVAGTVRTDDGAPAAGASVDVQFAGSGSTCPAAAADGSFEVGPFEFAAAPAPVVVRAVRADLAPATVTLAPGEPTRGVEIVLRRAVALRGRVVDAGGNPVAGTWLLLHDGAYGDEQRILSGADGRFATRMAPTARGDLVFVTHGYVVRRIGGALSSPGERDLGDVVVSAGGTIRGTVVREDGTPAERAGITVESLELGVAICEAHRGAGGAFEAWRVGPGEHALHVRDAAPPGVLGDWAPVVVRGLVAGTEGVRVVVRDGPGIVVRLHGPADAAGAPPRTFAAVRVATCRRGADGWHDETPLEGPGVHTVRVAAPAGSEVDLDLAADGGAWRAVALRVPDGAPLVVDAVVAPPDAGPR